MTPKTPLTPRLLSGSHDSPPDTDNFIDIELFVIVWHMLSTGNAKNLHTLIITEACKEFGRDEEVLTCVFSTCNLDHPLVNHSFVSGVHTLVDFVDDTEWCASE
jgi:hypothetical protein